MGLYNSFERLSRVRGGPNGPESSVELGGGGCTVQSHSFWGVGAALEGTAELELREMAGKGVCAGTPRESVFWGVKKKEERANSSSLAGQSLHTRTHTGKARTERGRFLSDMLTCRRATALPCGQGRRGRKGHGGGELKREAAGRGTEAPWG